MRRLFVVFCPVVLVAACSFGTSLGPSGTARAAPATAPASIALSTPQLTPTPVPVAGCPTDSTVTVSQYIDADSACFEAADVTIRAWVDYPPPMGFEGPTIEPAWVAYPPDGRSALWHEPPTGPDNLCDDDQRLGCAWFFPRLDPRSSLEMGESRWVIVTGHVGDPAAETCHYVASVGYPEGELPADAEAVGFCRNQFVITSMRDAP
jgi:hypothetical protein